MQFDSSTSSSSDDDHHQNQKKAFSQAPTAPLVGLGILEKPLPQIPLNVEQRGKQTTLDKFLRNRQASYPDPNINPETPSRGKANFDVGFSFQPGATEDILVRSTQRDRNQRKSISDLLDDRQSMPNLKESETTTTASRPSSINRLPHRPNLAHIQIPSDRSSPSHQPSSHSRVLQDHDSLRRAASSNSSIVTAIRDNSGRSTNNSQVGRQRLNRTMDGAHGSSSDALSAATAATRAYAASTQRASMESSRKISENSDTRGAANYRRQSTESSRKGSESGDLRTFSASRMNRASVEGGRKSSESGELRVYPTNMNKRPSAESGRLSSDSIDLRAQIPGNKRPHALKAESRVSTPSIEGMQASSADTGRTKKSAAGVKKAEKRIDG